MTRTVVGQNFLDEVAKDPFIDLIIDCKGKIFRAHRVFVCRKSEVLKKALVSDFTVSCSAYHTRSKTIFNHIRRLTTGSSSFRKTMYKPWNHAHVLLY